MSTYADEKRATDRAHAKTARRYVYQPADNCYNRGMCVY